MQEGPRRGTAHGLDGLLAESELLSFDLQGASIRGQGDGKFQLIELEAVRRVDA